MFLSPPFQNALFLMKYIYLPFFVNSFFKISSSKDNTQLSFFVKRFFHLNHLSSLLKSSVILVASSMVETIFGVRMTMSSVFLFSLDLLLKSSPKRGRSPRRGTLLSEALRVSEISPPSTMLCPEEATTEVLIFLTSIVGEAIPGGFEPISDTS